MEKSKPVVVGIGELLWDVFPEVKKAGGAPINFVYHATQLERKVMRSVPWATTCSEPRLFRNWIRTVSIVIISVRWNIRPEA